MSEMLVLIPSTSREWSDEPAHTRSLVRAVAAIKHRVWNYGVMLLASHLAPFFTFVYVIWQTVKTQKKCRVMPHFMRVRTACYCSVVPRRSFEKKKELVCSDQLGCEFTRMLIWTCGVFFSFFRVCNIPSRGLRAGWLRLTVTVLSF